MRSRSTTNLYVMDLELKDKGVQVTDGGKALAAVITQSA